MGLIKVAKKIVGIGGALAAMVFLPGLIAVSIIDITGRRFLQYSSTPLQELAWHFFFACVMFAIGYTHIKDRHVRVDIVRERLSSRAKARPDSQRLNGSVSCASRKARSSFVVARSRITGAENPRRIEGTGRAPSPSKRNDCSASVISSTVVGTTSSPLGFSRPTAMGMTRGSLTSWPGVGGVSCRKVSR